MNTKIITEDPDFPSHRIVLIFLLLAIMAPGYVSAEARNGIIGKTIPFSGTAPAIDTIYLIMTGPGVAQYGSRMDTSVSPVMT